MKHVMKLGLLILCIGLVTFFGGPGISAEQGPPPGQATPPSGQAGPPSGQAGPPGQAGSTPPSGQAGPPMGPPPNQGAPGAQPAPQGLGIGIATVDGNLAPKVDSEVRQTWCLKHEGTVNLVLPDKTICDCLTKTHAIVFASEDGWLELIGRSLHLALLTEKDPAIVVFVQQNQKQPYASKLITIIKHFKLPIFLWEEALPAKKAATP